ncbi:hypothetical protein BHE74_00021005 [Ensete ventricosum]|nr:hypothetical protein BHE74_00021005 [Ensete ventricosum]
MVPPKIDRRRLIEGEIDRQRSIEREKGKKKKRKRREKKEEKKVFDEMLMFDRVLRFVYIPCTADSGLAWEVLRNDRKSCAKLTEVRGIANSKDSVLMQELVHGRRSVRGHPKVRSELGAMEHHNFLFDMERIQQGTSCSARWSSPKGMVVSEISSGKYVKRKVASAGQISKRDKS